MTARTKVVRGRKYVWKRWPNPMLGAFCGGSGANWGEWVLARKPVQSRLGVPKKSAPRVSEGR